MVQQLVNGISVGAIYALVAVGFSLIFNVMKLVNFAHGGMILLGTYGAYWAMMFARVPAWGALLLAAVAGAVGSYLSEKIILRPIRLRQSPLIYFFVASITLFMLLEAVVSAVTGASVTAYPEKLGDGNWVVGPVGIARLDAVVLLVTIVALAGTVVLLRYTRIGLALRCAAYDPRAASLMGINLDRVIAVAFAVAGTLAGIAGFFLGSKYGVYPSVGQMVFKSFVACMVGGLGSLPGAVLGALLLGLLETLAIAYLHSGASGALTFVFLLLFLWIRPQGLLGVFVEEKV